MPIDRPLPDPVALKCPRCGRAGRYRLAKYKEITQGLPAPDALHAFAVWANCARARDIDPDWGERCGLVYDLEVTPF